MKRFKFMDTNKVLTTTSLYMSSGSGTAGNLFDRDPDQQFITSGESADGTTATISYVFGSSTNISRIMILNHNFAKFNIIYDSNTSNQFTPPLSQEGYAFSNLYYEFATQAVASIDINVWSTQSVGEEKKAGQVIFTDEKFEVEHNPNYDAYNPIFKKIGKEVELADGGIVSYFISKKFRAEIDFNYIPTTTYNNLRDLYDAKGEFIFVPFPVNTLTVSWFGDNYECIWVGDFEIMSYRSPILENGYTGAMSIAQIPD